LGICDTHKARNEGPSQNFWWALWATVAKGDARMAKLNAVAAISSGEATPICNQYEAQTYTYTADFHSDESV